MATIKFVQNPITKRQVRVGGRTYRHLIKEGGVTERELQAAKRKLREVRPPAPNAPSHVPYYYPRHSYGLARSPRRMSNEYAYSYSYPSYRRYSSPRYYLPSRYYTTRQPIYIYRETRRTKRKTRKSRKSKSKLRSKRRTGGSDTNAVALK